MELTGHTILITGGGTGIGLAFARKFVELGNEVIIIGRRQSKLDEAKAQLPMIHTFQSDVANPAAIVDLAAAITTQYPKLDVLMNNAGVYQHRNLRAPSKDLASLTSEMEINFSGTVMMNSAFIDVLAVNQGTIINVTSALAYVPVTAAPIYCATKAALHSYSTSLRFQLRDVGVTVIELMPPLVQTDIVPDDLANADFKIITTDVLVACTMKALKAGALEIRVGQSKQLHWMSRIAPGFINGQLFKGSESMIPPLKRAA
jgi:uncharacterized oxidoreductase